MFKDRKDWYFKMTVIMDYGHKNLESPRIGLKSKITEFFMTSPTVVPHLT